MATPMGDGVPGDAAGGAICASDPKDQATLREAMKRWPKRFATISEKRKAAWVNGLVIAGRVGRKLAASDDAETAGEGANLLVSVAKTGAMMESLNQKDEADAIKYERIDQGKATDLQAVDITTPLSRRVTVLPAPESSPSVAAIESNSSGSCERREE